MSFWQQVYFGNSVEQYVLALAVFLGIIVVTRVLRVLVERRIKRIAASTRNKLDDTLLEVSARTRLLLVMLISLYASSLLLVLPSELAHALPLIATVALFLQLGLWFASFIKISIENYRERKRQEGDINGLPVLGVVSIFARVALWLVVLLLILDNFGVDVTALVAGLGIGGIAIALAVQNILSDLLSSVSIMLDKPFQVGDFINLDTMTGTVENIGIKTTRVRSLSGEGLVLPNSDLVKARIRNFQELRERRVVFTIGVVYQVSIEQVEAIPGLIRECIEAQELTRFDRAHFTQYGDSALIFEVVYFVTTPEYNKYMDIQQAINLGIMRRFQERGIEFAYPTRTLYMQAMTTPAPAAQHAAPAQ